MTPLRHWETARRNYRAARRAVWLAPTLWLAASAVALEAATYAELVRARRRLVLSALAHLVVAAVIIGVVYGLIVLMWAAFGADPAPSPDVTNVQLPTL